MQFLTNGGDIFEDENAVETCEEEAIPLRTLKLSEGLETMYQMKEMCVEKGYTDLFRLLKPTIAEAERMVASGKNKKQKEITEYFAKN